MVSNTLDPQLHARALDLVVALLHAEQQGRVQGQACGGEREAGGQLQQQQVSGQQQLIFLDNNSVLI